MGLKHGNLALFLELVSGKGKVKAPHSEVGIVTYILASLTPRPSQCASNLQYTKTKGGGLVYHINDVMTHAFFAPLLSFT